MRLSISQLTQVCRHERLREKTGPSVFMRIISLELYSPVIGTFALVIHENDDPGYL